MEGTKGINEMKEIEEVKGIKEMKGIREAKGVKGIREVKGIKKAKRIKGIKRIEGITRTRARKRFAVMTAALLAAFAFTGCGLSDSHAVKIVLPADSQAEFVYSEEEITPQKSSITLAAGEGLGDTLVVLESGGKETIPTYLTPGMPVKLEVEKGVWYRVGVASQSLGEEDITVYVDVTGAEWRIQ